MSTTRYALFETRTPPLGLGAHGAGLIARSFDLGLGSASGGGSPVLATADTLTFKTAPEAAACGRGKTLLRVPRIPIRLIPHALAGSAAEGSPWGVAAIGADKSAFTGAGVCVAVLDSGIDPGHPAFHGLVTPGNFRDFTGTGLTDTIGHGTHCAGIIFGRDVGGTRIGIARGVTQILIGKIADANTVTTTEQLEEALLWAVHEGADIISMSVGLDFLGHTRQLQAADYPPEAAMVAALADYRDYAKFFDSLLGRIISPGAAGRSALVVAAVGNDSHADGLPAYRVGATLPAVADRVIAVGALGQNAGKLTVAPFSNIDANVCAPGVGILSAFPGGGLATLSGTSQAAPHVAGAAALWWEKLRGAAFARPEPASVRERMLGRSDFECLSPPAAAEEIGMGLVAVP